MPGIPPTHPAIRTVELGLCAICQDNHHPQNSSQETPIVLSALRCNHVFHQQCLIPWIKEHDTCPICRTSIISDNPSILRVPRPSQSTSTSPRQRAGALWFPQRDRPPPAPLRTFIPQQLPSPPEDSPNTPRQNTRESWPPQRSRPPSVPLQTSVPQQFPSPYPPHLRSVRLISLNELPSLVLNNGLPINNPIEPHSAPPQVHRTITITRRPSQSHHSHCNCLHHRHYSSQHY